MTDQERLERLKKLQIKVETGIITATDEVLLKSYKNITSDEFIIKQLLIGIDVHKSEAYHHSVNCFKNEIKARGLTIT